VAASRTIEREEDGTPGPRPVSYQISDARHGTARARRAGLQGRARRGERRTRRRRRRLDSLYGSIRQSVTSESRLGLARLPEGQLTIGQRVFPAQSWHAKCRSTVLYVTRTVLVRGGTPYGQHRSTNLAKQRRISRITAGGAGGARTHDRQIMSPLL
jgi:hypothetical protein